MIIQKLIKHLTILITSCDYNCLDLLPGMSTCTKVLYHEELTILRNTFGLDVPHEENVRILSDFGSGMISNLLLNNTPIEVQPFLKNDIDM